MKIFLTGATGAVGKRLLPMLVERGHHVVAATRSAGKMDALLNAGAEPVILDALDRDAVMKAVMATRPEAVVHEMTALSNMNMGNFKKLDEELAQTNRLRTEGTEYLLAAAQAAGARTFVAQSYSGWPNVREGGRIKTELDPLDPNPPAAMRNTLDAIRKPEAMVSQASGLTGVVLRYGAFYGPGTSFAAEGESVKLIRQRKLPIVGDGAGVWSFIHIDDVANATRIVIEGSPGGIYNIVDDEPAEVSVWLPELARILGAKPPRHLPAWLARWIIGDAGLSMMTKVRGSSNAKAQRILGWRPIYPSWREGFRHGLSDQRLRDRSEAERQTVPAR